ncbi:MAG: PAS domain-containing protein [Desulfobacterales bacterium]|nr:PAS domain-containing protein [Desulfobacterales bacterium]
MEGFRSKIRKMAEETSRISTTDPTRRLTLEVGDDPGDSDLERLVRAINDLADRRQKLHMDLQREIQRMETETNEEKNIFAAALSELLEGVVICNARGQILLYNKRAGQLLGFRGNDSGRAVEKATDEKSEISPFPGRPVFTLIEKNLIDHALDEINEKLKLKAADAASSFIAEGREGRVLRIRAAPILDRRGRFSGFILALNDITARRETDNRVDDLLRSLTRSARSPLASIRSAVELILEHPDMERERLARFRQIIHNESITLSHILNTVAEDYSSLVKTRWPLHAMTGGDLAAMIARRAKDRLGVVVDIEKPHEEIRVRVDSWSMIMAILHVLNQLKKETGVREFTCALEKRKNFATLDLLWQGPPVRSETPRSWEDRMLSIHEEKSPLTLREVLERHGAEMWARAHEGPGEKPYIRFLLPADETFDMDETRQPAILPESSPGFYDFGLFKPSGRNPGLDNRLLTELSYTVLIREISESKSIRELMKKHQQLPALIQGIISSGANVRNVTWLITAFSDAILDRLVHFALAESDPPPVKFAFIILGSEGRKEQTLKTDQDNAIIYEDATDESGKSEEAVNEYFLKLGKKICAGLNRIGYDFCTGDVMAQNPRWCQPLSVWKKYFSGWIHAAEPEDLLHSSIFFDFRLGAGDSGLVRSLADFLADALTSWSGFFRHLTENAVYFKPPIGFFGNFIVKKKGRRLHCLNIKRAMNPIVDIARIYALKHNIRETNTQERLRRLRLKKALTRKEYNEIEQAYSYMMQLRFARQIHSILRKQEKPDNYINPKTLSAIQRKMLKEAFRRVEKMQKKVFFEFTGVSDPNLE